MPVDSMLVSAAVILMFLIFGAVLAWGDLQTRPAGATAVARDQKRPGH